MKVPNTVIFLCKPALENERTKSPGSAINYYTEMLLTVLSLEGKKKTKLTLKRNAKRSIFPSSNKVRRLTDFLIVWTIYCVWLCCFRPMAS